MRDELVTELREAAIAVSDILMGGPVFATMGNDVTSVISNVRTEQARIIPALTRLNLALREIDREEKDSRLAENFVGQETTASVAWKDPGQAGVEKEIAPEMIEAGAMALLPEFDLPDRPRCRRLAEEVLRAALARCPSRGEGGSAPAERGEGK